MKVKFNLPTLQKYMLISEKALDTKIAYDVLKGIKIIAQDESIKIITSNSSFVVEVTIPNEKNSYEIIEEGEVILNGIVFANSIKKLNDEELEIIYNPNLSNLAIIKTKKTKYELITSQEYPKIQFGIEKNNIVLNREMLINFYNKTKHSVLNDQSKPILTGIDIEFTNKIKVISTDGKRISKLEVRNENDDISKKIVIPKKCFSEIEKILKEIDDEFLFLSIYENQLNIKASNVQIKSKLIEGEFPNLESRFDFENKYQFEINNLKLFEILGRIESISPKSFVTIKIDHGEIVIINEAQEIGKIEERCEIKNLKGNPFPITFVTKYLIEAMNSISESNIIISIASEVEPFQIEGSENKANKQLIVPMRMN